MTGSTPWPWFRFYSEALGDRKIASIVRKTQLPKALVIGCWATVLALANDSPVRGLLLLAEDVPVTLSELHAEMGVDDTTFLTVMQEFKRLDMILDGDGVLSVCNWNKRQFASDHSAERVRAWRAKRQATVECNANATTTCNDAVTLHDRYCNAPDTESDTDTESETESDSHVAPNGAKREEAQDMPTPEQMKSRIVQAMTRHEERQASPKA